MNETDQPYRPGFFKRLFIFGTTPKLWLHLLGMALATLLVLWLTFGLLKCYTQHGRTYEVANFIDMDVKELKQQVEDGLYRFEFHFKQSEFMDMAKKDRVIKQDPKPGTPVKDGRTVYITYHPAESRPVDIAGYYSAELDMVLNDIRNKKLVVGEIEKTIDPDVPGTVLKVYHKGKLLEDAKVKRYDRVTLRAGDTLDLVVAEAFDAGSTQIPNLACLTYSEALFKIRSGHNLAVGTVSIDATVTDSLTAYVVQQYPIYEPDKFIQVGQQVDIRLSQVRPSNCGSGYDDIPGNDFPDDGTTTQDPGSNDDLDDDLDF